MYILIWIICGIFALVMSYFTYKNTVLYMNELFVIGIIIFLLGPISLIIQIGVTIKLLIQHLIKKK